MEKTLLPVVVSLSLMACPVPVVEDPPLPIPDMNGPTSAQVDGGADAGTPGPAAVEWRPCPLKTGSTGGTMAECAVLRTPLEASNPSGPTIEYFVKRYRPPNGRGLRAMWMLQGGPGASGLVFEGLSEQFGTRFPDVDYYFPDHRGTGRSTRLSCPMQESQTSEAGLYITAAEWPACLAAVQASEGARLAAFNMTNAANDVGVAIAATREAGQPVFVYGVSYGTSLALRYLQLYPSQADGVVLDSIAPPGISLYRQDEDANEAARDYFAACSANAVCGAKLGPAAWDKAEALFTKLKAGHCPEIAVPGIPTHVLLRRAFGGFLMDPSLRAYIAPIVYRADRCNAADVDALSVLMNQLTQEPAMPPDEHRLWGWVLSQNILHSEFAETPRPTAAQLSAMREPLVASRDVTEGFEPTLNWPVYPADRFTGQWPEPQTPIVMLQGGLDPATILRKARAAKERLNRPGQTWVEIPSATHTVVASSPYVNAVGERRSCGTAVMMSFLENPGVTPDTSCVSRVEPISWALPNGNLTLALFGRRNAWEER
ncbi:MAG: alpha/beta hydrolase [Myxococcaceae bacterium]|jgi:pimeloyl-ACP methyl ester carboxylesterase|nr:alpha/beta hydrolase [Myxococcaceae bacterium]